MSVDQDATSLWYVPSSAAQWTELLDGTGLANPTSLWLCQEASGDLADSIGSNTLPAFGTPLYQQTVTGWTRKGVGTDDATGDAFDSLDAGLPDPATTSVLFLAFVAVTSTPAGSRQLMRIGQSDPAHLRITAASRHQLVSGSGTSGTIDPGTDVHPCIIRLNQTANTVTFFSDNETVTDTFASPGTKRLAIGAGDITAANAQYVYMAMWQGADAEMSDGEIATLLSQLENGPTVIVPELAEGTTLAALQAGSCSLKYTVAIEGYSHLLTDATPQQAIDAWYDDVATHHYESALGGLYVSMDCQQQLDWRNPFPRGGQLTLHIMPDADDTFGKVTHKRNAGAQTELQQTLDRDDSTVWVKTVNGFDEAGEIFIGTECIAYTGTEPPAGAVTLAKFTGCTRGKYAPMVNGNVGSGWSEYHRVGTATHEVMLNPLVTSIPRVWIGKWVSVYLHKYDASIPALNSRADAQRVFAGRIVSIVDDPATGATVVEVKHALDCVQEHTVGGRDQWRGKIRNGIEIKAGWRFKMKDRQVSGTGVPDNETADDLVVVSGAPASTYEIQAGIVTIDQIYDALNAWWATAGDDADLHGTYSIGYWQPEDKTLRSYIYWSHTGSPSFVSFDFELPQPVALFLGYDADGTGTTLGANPVVTSIVKSGNKSSTGPHSEVGDNTLQRYTIYSGATGRAIIDDVQGTFKDQWAYLPSSSKPPNNFGEGWGVYLIDNRMLAFGWMSSLADEIWDLQLFPEQFGLEGAHGYDWHKLPLTQDSPKHTDIRQIFVLEMPFGDALKRIFKSTGSTNYNDGTYDTLAHGLGIGMPGDLVDATFLASIDNLPHADKPISLLIDRTTKLADLIAGELILRRAFLRWKNGRLEFATWRSAVAGNSVGTLQESNKAAPAGTIDHHRSVTVENGGWAVPIVKIQYNRSLKGSPDGSDAYRDSIALIDRAAVDDLGGDGPSITINARGTLGDFHQTGAAIGTLANGFLSSMPYFSRPARQSSRSIDQRYFEGYSIGDIVLVSDGYARDPDTGARGVATRPGIITRHRYSLGGFTPNSDQAQPQGGEVDLFFLDVNRVAEYVPAAQIDWTSTFGSVSAGYDTVTDEFWCLTNEYCESGETQDPARFTAGDKIRIIERDPADPAAPLSWDRVVAARTNNRIQITAALAAPAWDATKKYIIVFDDYPDAVTTQHTKVFQADGAVGGDGQVSDTRAPYEYGIGGQSTFTTTWAASDDVELPPDASYGDGVGRDTGHEVALIRLLNNLDNYKTGISSPVLSNAVLNGGAGFLGGTWMLVQCTPIFLTNEVLLNSATRVLSVAPYFRSFNGASASLRVTLSKTPPTDTDFLDVDRGTVYDEVTFTTTSTTFAVPTADTLQMTNVKNSLTGCAWLYVEVTSPCETWGLSHVQEGPIVY